MNMRGRGLLVGAAALLISLATPTTRAQNSRGLEFCRIPLVRNAEQAPVIDGVMHPVEWRYALTMTGLVSNEGAFSQRQATIHYISDGAYLYVGLDIPAVPSGTVPEVVGAPASNRAGYMTFINSDRLEIRFTPPDFEQTGYFYVVADAVGNTYIEHVRSEHKPISDELLEYRSSFDGERWLVELRLPAKFFGLERIEDGQQWGVNANAVRLYPLTYDGLVAGPHSHAEAIMALDAPAVKIERLGNLPKGELDLKVGIREYEGDVATPREGAYDEREIESGGLQLQASGKVARVSWVLEGADGVEVERGGETVELRPARIASVGVRREFTPQGKNVLRLRVEKADNAAAFADADGKTTLLYSASFPFLPYNEAEEVAWMERVERGTVLGSWRFNPAFFPYWEKAKIQAVFFEGKVREQAKRLRVGISADNGFQATQEVAIVEGDMQVDSPDGFLDIEIPGLPAGNYTVRGEVLDANGEVVSTQERQYQRVVFPWEKNQYGKSRGVIEPWTPMAVNGRTVKCWGREYILSNAGLPERIVSQDKDVLSQPVGFELRGQDGRELAMKPIGELEFLEVAEDRVRWRGRAVLGDNVKVEITGLAEYDGFTWFEISLEPEKAVALASGRIIVEMPDAEAQLMHFQPVWARNNYSGAVPSGEGVVFESLAAASSGRRGNFTPHVWLGNLHRGLSWYADSDEGWSSASDRSAQEVIREGEKLHLVLNVIAKPTVLDQPRKIEFGLMASPFKPLMPIRDIPTRGVNWLSFKDNKTVVQAHMYGTYPPDFDYSLINEHIGERRLYFNKHEMGAALPERAVFDNEWGGMNPAPDYPGAPERFGPGMRSRTINRSLTDSRIDMLVYYIAQLAKHSSMAATYWDITGIGKSGALLENGAYVDPETGTVVSIYDIRKSRDLFKRVATMWQEVRGEPDYMEIHSTNHICPPFYSFAYNWLNFEWLWPNPSARREDGQWQDFIDLRPLDLFATEGVPSQWGVWINSINSGRRPEDDPAAHRRINRSGSAMSILHNHGAPAGCGGPQLNEPPTIGRRDKIEFVGYWDEDGRVASDHELVRAGYWRTDDKIELAVVNLDLESRVATISIPLTALGWNGVGATRETTAEDEAETIAGTHAYRTSPEKLAALEKVIAEAAARRLEPQIKVADGVLSLTLPVDSHDYRLFIFERN